MKRLRVASLCAGLLIASVAHGQVYKCAKAGKTIYQDFPCDGFIPHSATEAPARNPGTTPPASPQLSEQERGAAFSMVLYASCTRRFPELLPKIAMNYQAWRSRNAAQVARIESDAQYQVALAEQLKQVDKHREANLPPAAQQAQRAECEDILAAAFNAPATGVARTPQECWNGFMSAVRSGDADKAIAYVAAGSRGRYREIFRNLGPDGLRGAAQDFGTLASEMQVTGDMAVGILTRKGPDGKPHGFDITFMRSRLSGGWLIESM